MVVVVVEVEVEVVETMSGNKNDMTEWILKTRKKAGKMERKLEVEKS